MPFVTPEYVIRVFLVFVRIGAVLMAAPMFGHGSVPVRVKIFFSLLMAYALVGLVPGPLPEHITEPLPLLLAVAVEVLTGVSIGYAAQFIFWTVQFAGEIVGFQMGLSLAQAYNPIDGQHANPIGRIIGLSFLMVFILIDGHHLILQGLVSSFSIVPLAGAEVQATGPLLLQWTGGLFVTAMRVASPFMVTIFLVDLTLGIFARMVPQADLFSLGLPLKLFVGVGLTFVFMQNFFPTIPGHVSHMLDDLLSVVEALTPR